jgi:hypothetical protein
LKAKEVADKLDDFIAIIRDAGEKIKAIPPTRTPQEEEGEPEDEDMEVPSKDIKGEQE